MNLIQPTRRDVLRAAGGAYSDVAAQNSVGKKYLRGYQPTNRQGIAYFLTA